MRVYNHKKKKKRDLVNPYFFFFFTLCWLSKTRRLFLLFQLLALRLSSCFLLLAKTRFSLLVKCGLGHLYIRVSMEDLPTPRKENILNKQTKLVLLATNFDVRYTVLFFFFFSLFDAIKAPPFFFVCAVYIYMCLCMCVCVCDLCGGILCVDLLKCYTLFFFCSFVGILFYYLFISSFFCL